MIRYLAFKIFFLISFSFANAEENIGFSVATTIDPYYSEIINAARIEAKKNGVELLVADAQNDPALQISQLEKLLSSGVDALILSPIHVESLGPILSSFAEQKIPVIGLDARIENAGVLFNVRSNYAAGGMLAGKFLCENAIEGNFVQLTGALNSQDFSDLSSGFREGIKKWCPKRVLVERASPSQDQSRARETMMDLLQDNRHVAAVFAHSSDLSFGAMRAFIESRRNDDVVIVGFGSENETRPLVEKGKLSATVVLRPSEIGQLAVRQAQELLTNGLPDKELSVFGDLSLLFLNERGVIESGGTQCRTFGCPYGQECCDGKCKNSCK